MSRTKTVTLIRGSLLDDNEPGGKKYILEYTAVDPDLVGKSEQSARTKNGKIVLKLSRWLLTESDWTFDERILFEYARRYLEARLFDQTLGDTSVVPLNGNKETRAQLSSFDMNLIEMSFGKPYAVSVPE